MMLRMGDLEYRVCPYCGAGCPFATDGQPCWGEVRVVSDFTDDEVVHACEGHATFYYQPRPVEEDVAHG